MVKVPLEQLVWIVIKLHEKYAKRGLGRTKLVKLLFFIDLEAMKRFSSKITGLTWFRWFYGPFNPEIYRILEELMSQGVIDIDVYVHDDLRTEFIYCTKKPMKVELSRDIKALVKEVVRKYAKKSLIEVLKDAYEKMGDRDLGEVII